jgi:hypothetical protein
MLRVFEYIVLGKLFELKRDEVTGEWRRLHKEELYALYPPPNITPVIKLRRMGWTRHVARVRERRGVYTFFGEET